MTPTTLAGEHRVSPTPAARAAATIAEREVVVEPRPVPLPVALPALPGARREAPPAPPRRRGFDRPHRTMAMRVANRVGAVVSHRSRALRLEPEHLLGVARRHTGLHDFGSDEFHEPLAVLLAALEHDAALSPLGRYFARGQVVSSLTNRLLLEQLWSERPEVLDRPVVKPLVVMGLPRTGTTLLQHLLAEDRDNQVLLGWEAAKPVLEPGPVLPSRSRADAIDPRIRASQRGMQLLDYVAPDARALHPVDAELPTECVTLFNNSFASLELATINWVPRYLDWCLSAPMGAHYAYFARQLRTLTASGHQRWVLKSPAHLFWVDELLAEFPDACIVQTHRDPAEVVSSFCSLSSVFIGIGSDRVNPPAIGRRWLDVWAEGLARAQRSRSARRGARFVDVRYPELVADPLGSVRAIYDAFGIELTAGAEARMRAYLARHPQHRRGVHSYSLEQFDLASGAVAERFAAYRARYHV